jgi:hypothetical protein
MTADLAAQRLPEHIEDDRVLDLVAEVHPEHDDGPEGGKPGRRSRPAAANEGGRLMLPREGDLRVARDRLPARPAPCPQGCPSCGRSAV